MKQRKFNGESMESSNKNEKTNFILLHGSWHAGWCWYKIVPRLEKAGHRVFAPDLPAHGKDWRFFRGRITAGAMVKKVTDILDSLEEPATIIVHSRNGIIASLAAEARPEKIDRIVYLASFMLRDGERVAEYFFGDRYSLLQGNVIVDRLKITDMIKQSVYKDALYADCSPDDVALANALLSPEPSLPALTRLRLTDKNYGSVDRYYIELTQDRAVSLNLQRRLVKQSPVKKVYSIDASHSVYFSRPDDLSAIILNIHKTQNDKA